MKRFLKISTLVVGILVLLLLSVLLVLQSPKAQTMAVQKVLGMLGDKIQGDITVGKVHVRPFDAVVLKDVAIVDRAPYTDPDDPAFQPLDTFARAHYITVRLRPATLLRSSVIDLSEVYVEDGYFVMTTEPGHMSNIKRIFSSSGQPKAEKEPDDKEILRAARVEIDGFRFRLRNYTDTSRVPADAINWADLDVSDIRLKGRKLKMHGKVVEGIADKLSFREKSGLDIRNMSGEVRVGDGQTHIGGLRIQDAYSNLQFDEFNMTYAGMESFSHFVDEVRLDAGIRDSRLDLRTIRYFAPTLKDMSLIADLNAKVEGPVRDLRFRNFRFRTIDSGLAAQVNGTLRGLPDAQNMQLDFQLKDMNFTLPELERFIRGWAPSTHIGLDRFAKGERFTFNGTASGPINKLDVQGDFTSGAGSFSTSLNLHDILDASRPIRIGGGLRTRSLDLGRIAGIEALGPVDLHTSVQATLAGNGPSVRIDSLIIDRLSALGYDYTGLAAVGSYTGDAFDGRIICNDPNLNFIFQGIFTLSPKTRNAVYQFYANLGYADLNALNIDKRGTSQMSLRTTANFNRVDGGDMIGTIDIYDVELTDAYGFHDVGDISITSHINDDVNRIRLQSDFAEGTYVGSRFITDFVKDLQDLSRKELPSLLGPPEKEWAGQSYDLHFQTHDTRDILSFIKPGIYLADSTDLRLSISPEGLIDGDIQSRRIALKDKYLKGVELQLDNADGALNAVLTGDELNVSPILTRGNRLVLMADDDEIGIGFSYDNETVTTNKGEFYASALLDRSEKDSLLMISEILPSSLYLNGEAWSIRRTSIDILGPGIEVAGLVAENGPQSIRMEGGWSPTVPDSLHIAMTDLDLHPFAALLGQGIALEGKATGTGLLISPVGDKIDLSLDMAVNDLVFADEPLGRFRIQGGWDDGRDGFHARVRNDNNGTANLDLDAFYSLKEKTADGRLQLDKLDLGLAAPFLTSVFSDMDGYLSGGVDFSGPVSGLALESDDLRLEEAMMRVAYTDVPYIADGPVRLSSRGLEFQNVRLRDRYNAEGRLNGRIGWQQFQDMNLDLDIDMTAMEALDLSEKENETFYGHIFATGHVDIAGPLDALLLEVDAETAKEGSFHIPLGGAGSAGTSDLLVFKEPVRNLYIDPYDLLMNTLVEKEKKHSDFAIKLHVRPNASVQALLEIDKEAGNVLSGHGNGQIDVEVRPSTSLFSINGNYTLTDGLFHFSALNVARRDFTIQDGSSIRFNGDIMESDLDIDALYKTKASIGTLIADTTSVANRRTVECGIHVTEKLRNPRVAFSINVPDLDPTTQGRVENALNSEDKVQKQFLSLLVSGGFLPDEPSGIVNNSTMLNSTVTEIMASQLSNILQKLDIPIDLGLDYQQNASGNDVFDVAVSTELFNNRVIVNGAIGNRQYTTSSGQEVVGDLDIEIKLDRTGAFRLNLFSHSADQYTNYLDNLQRNGVGLTYQKEYDSFRRFLRELFSSKKKRREMQEEQTGQAGRKRIRIEADAAPADTTSVPDPVPGPIPTENE